MVISKKSSTSKCNLVSKGEKNKQVTKLKYLGYLITSDDRCTSEVSKRIAMATDTFQRNISITTTIRVIRTYEWSVLLYGSECSTISKEIEKKKTVETWFIRRMMRNIMDIEKTNEVVLKEANLEQSLIKTIRQRDLQFLGHIFRHKGLERSAITGKIEGKRSRGRKRITFIDNLMS
ncbi:endonuclease-reverse transcriptase [Plakobranchus ocellatus]|uniref:Endonuclease-reverse transcriptase n=1 Tax=Plakobranchus ocellatus TaxID=259542 RepID=A0AAV4DR97_9GAST|nr:endonuclease-reverse transcriptase [Plakobranchus ocellatus]